VDLKVAFGSDPRASSPTSMQGAATEVLRAKEETSFDDRIIYCGFFSLLKPEKLFP
jgi:hypothetical protein